MNVRPWFDACSQASWIQLAVLATRSDGRRCHMEETDLCINFVCDRFKVPLVFRIHLSFLKVDVNQNHKFQTGVNLFWGLLQKNMQSFITKVLKHEKIKQLDFTGLAGFGH